jgi:hypothetical protein
MVLTLVGTRREEVGRAFGRTASPRRLRADPRLRGDRRRTALIARDGSFDWFASPIDRFANGVRGLAGSPSRGLVRTLGASFEVTRRYIPIMTVL